MAKQFRALRCLTIVGAAPLLAIIACGDSDSATCDAAPRPGMELMIADASTKASLLTQAHVTMRRESAPFDSASGEYWQALTITNARPGAYNVRVEMAGYQTMSRDVVVPASSTPCEIVVKQNVAFELVPQ